MPSEECQCLIASQWLRRMLVHCTSSRRSPDDRSKVVPGREREERWGTGWKAGRDRTGVCEVEMQRGRWEKGGEGGDVERGEIERERETEREREQEAWNQDTFSQCIMEPEHMVWN